MADPLARDVALTLHRLAKKVREAAEAEQERCDLCAEPVPPSHRHLLLVDKGEIFCVCAACAILFDKKEAGAGEYRLVPERRLFLANFLMDDLQWLSLRVPVGLAFFVESTPQHRVRALYPGLMGATEAELPADVWRELVNENPVLREMEPDVETLLVNRARGARQYFLVPVDDAYRLTGLVRTRWRGSSGGQEVWEAIRRFFDELTRKAHLADSGLRAA